MLRPENERFNVADGLDEVVRYSLLERTKPDESGEQFVGAPLASAMFGRRELTVSPFKTAVEADRKLLMDFGAGKKRDAHRGALPRIENLMRAVATRVASGDKVLNEYLPILEYLANRCPRSFLKLADLVLELNDGPMGRDMAKGYLRSFIQNADIVEKRIGWLRLGELCRLDDDGKRAIHAFCEAAVLPTTDLNDLSNDANRLNNLVRSLKQGNMGGVSPTELRESLSEVIAALSRRILELTATDCSRLAWLLLNTSNSDRALDVARTGIDKDPYNQHCQRLIERLTQ